MVRPIEVLIVGDETSLARALGKAQANLSAFDQRMTRTGKSLTHAGRTLTRDLTLPIIGVGVASAKLALDFGTAMERVQGLTGASAKQTEQWSRQLLALGPKVAQTPQQLADTLYFVASSGAKVNQVLPITAQAARDAAAGMGDAQTVAQLLTSAMNAYGAKALSARSASDALTEAIKLGKAEPGDLAASLGRVIPVAQAMGVRFQEVAGTVAELTNTGLSADEAVTAVRATLTGLLKPTTQTVSVLNDLGLSAAGVRKEIRDKGLNTTLQDLAKRVGDNKDQLGKLFPNVRALAGFLALTGQNAGNVRDALDKMNHSVGASDKAFQTASHSADFQLHKSLASLEADGIKIGNVLLPVVANLAHDIAGLADSFERLSPREQEAVLGALAFSAALGPILSISGNTLKTISLMSRGFGSLSGAFTTSSAAAATSSSAFAGMTGGVTGLATGAAAAAPLLTGLGVAAVVATPLVAALALGLLTTSDNTQGMTGAMRDARTAADELKGALHGLQGANLDVRQAELDRTTAAEQLAKDQRELVRLTREGKKGTAEYNQVSERALQDDLNLGRAKGNLYAATQRQHDAQKRLNQINRDFTASLVAASLAAAREAAALNHQHSGTIVAASATSIFTGKMGELARQLAKSNTKQAAMAIGAEQLAHKIHGIPTARQVNVYYKHNMGQLAEQARILAGEISSIPSTKTVSIQFAQAHGTPLTRSGGRQHGGPVTGGHAYIVGERRPELFVPNQSGRIMPRVPALAGGPELIRAGGSLGALTTGGHDLNTPVRLLERILHAIRYLTNVVEKKGGLGGGGRTGGGGGGAAAAAGGGSGSGAAAAAGSLAGLSGGGAKHKAADRFRYADALRLYSTGHAGRVYGTYAHQLGAHEHLVYHAGSAFAVKDKPKLSKAELEAMHKAAALEAINQLRYRRAHGGRSAPPPPAWNGGGGAPPPPRYGDIHIHFDGPVLSTNDAEADKLARRIAPRIKRYL